MVQIKSLTVKRQPKKGRKEDPITDNTCYKPIKGEKKAPTVIGTGGRNHGNMCSKIKGRRKHRLSSVLEEETTICVRTNKQEEESTDTHRYCKKKPRQYTRQK